MNRVNTIIHLDAARKQGLTGKGVGVAILDTGIGYHPDLFPASSTGYLVRFVDFVNHQTHYYDDNGHGTHITGIIAGSGAGSQKLYRGIAPGCHFLSLKVLNQRGEGRIEHVLQAVQWLIEHQQKYRIRIVNISIGSSKGRHFSEDSPLVQSINSLWEHGMLVLTAAGNHGPGGGSIGAPGNSRKIITVGSSDPLQQTNTNDYSSRGPTEMCIKKPDVVAPGSHVVSCHPSPQKDASLFTKGNASYQARSGTSMSTPIVSGCLALLLEKYPHLTNREVKLHLRNTSLDLGFHHTRQGWGLIQCDKLLETPPALLS
ncbi:MAG: S8 family peptidase [Lachnospiraceae bacterium]|nr:S8 family peptidase [Lachnospiraceae bacterium]